MGKKLKSDVFIEIAQAMNSGQERKANEMINIVGRSIATDNRKKEINPTIELKRKEKVIFSRH